MRAFRDSDGDGVGDFRGLINRLDYLQGLGVTALWLLPFYPSPSATMGTTSRTIEMSTRPTGRCAISAASCARRTAGGCAW